MANQLLNRRLHDLKNEDLSDTDKENIVSSEIIQQINRVLNINLAHKYPHIVDNEVSIEISYYIINTDQLVCDIFLTYR